MSRSKKKVAIRTISKAWDKFKERVFRKKAKKFCQEAQFDPDKDWEVSNPKKMGDLGTRLGFMVKLDPNDTWYDESERIRRK